MILRIRSLAKVSNFLLFPLKSHIIFPIVSKKYFRYFSTTSSSIVECYPFTNNVSYSQEEKVASSGRKFDLDLVIAKALAAGDENEVFQSLMHDAECKTIEFSHGFVTRLLYRFQDDWKSALGVFRWVATSPGYKPLPELYDKLVDILGKMKQMDKMKAFLEVMRINQLVTLNTISKVMRRYTGAGDWKDAVKIFDELENFGLKKNTESMNLLLDTLCKERRVEQARAIFVELRSHIPPNANTFNIFIHGWCKIKRVEEAQWTIEEMKGNGFRPCVISYSTIIQFYCYQSNFNKVHELFDEMKVQNCPPNVVTFTTLLHTMTKLGDFKEALKIAEKMRSFDCKPDTLFYNALLHTLGRVGYVHEALYIFTKEMARNEVKPNTSTYNTMIAMFCHHKQEQRALEYLNSLENSPYFKPDVQSFYPLLKLYFRCGKIDNCLTILNDIVKKHHLCLDLATYTLLIHGLCKGNTCELAYKLFKDMIAQSIKPRYVTCSLLLKEIKQKNMYNEAEMIEEFMKNME